MNRRDKIKAIKNFQRLGTLEKPSLEPPKVWVCINGIYSCGESSMNELEFEKAKKEQDILVFIVPPEFADNEESIDMTPYQHLGLK